MQNELVLHCFDLGDKRYKDRTCSSPSFFESHKKMHDRRQTWNLVLLAPLRLT